MTIDSIIFNVVSYINKNIKLYLQEIEKFINDLGNQFDSTSDLADFNNKLEKYQKKLNDICLEKIMKDKTFIHY